METQLWLDSLIHRSTVMFQTSTGSFLLAPQLSVVNLKRHVTERQTCTCAQEHLPAARAPACCIGQLRMHARARTDDKENDGGPC